MWGIAVRSNACVHLGFLAIMVVAWKKMQPPLLCHPCLSVQGCVMHLACTQCLAASS